MKNLLQTSLWFVLSMYCSQTLSQGTDQSALQAQRNEAGAAMIEGCSAYFGASGLRAAVRKAESAGTVGLTEDAMRKTFASENMRGMITGVCSCILARPLARMDQASTPAELEAIVVESTTPEALRTIADDSKERCASLVQFPALIPPRERPATQDWQPIGTWQDTAAYVDALSVNRLGGDKVQAWVRAVFARPRRTSDGDAYASIELLQNFDCAKETVQTVSTAAFSDAAGKNVAYRFEKGDVQARFDPVGTGSSQRGMFDWACATSKHP